MDDADTREKSQTQEKRRINNETQENAGDLQRSSKSRAMEEAVLPAVDVVVEQRQSVDDRVRRPPRCIPLLGCLLGELTTRRGGDLFLTLPSRKLPCFLQHISIFYLQHLEIFTNQFHKTCCRESQKM